MKVSDLIFQTPSPNPRGGRPGICRVRVFVSPVNGVIALMTDLGQKNTGKSVTNSVEFICKALVGRGIVDDSATFIEHHECGMLDQPDFSLVSLSHDGLPKWESMSIQETAQFIDCTLSELYDQTLMNARLYDEIERIRNSVDPFIDSPYPELPEIINRREAIREKMIPKKELIDLISSGATERELQTLLKRDLSILAEVYANPKEDYICFSEFPVANGAVDFAVFSGTSRMDVILIEVKGANFALVNRGPYENFSAKINEAAKQIRNRFRAIYQNFEEFRRAVHSIRETVESGKQVHNSLLGPQGHLEVDPEKDIYVRCVVIGGRCRNDLDESRMRHDFEMRSTPPVKLESWDSWLKKIQRE